MVRLKIVLLALVGLLIGALVTVVGRQRTAGWLLAASMLLITGALGVAGLISLAGQLGDGDKFDAPREQIAITNGSTRPIYLIVPGSPALTESDLADSRFFVNGVTLPGQTVRVILRDGSWSSSGEACLNEEFVIVTSKEDRRDYSHNVRDASGQTVSPKVSAEDLVIAYRRSDGCWSQSTAFLAWDGGQLRQAQAPASVPASVGWILAAVFGTGVPQIARRLRSRSRSS